jgi:hypothetical protein
MDSQPNLKYLDVDYNKMIEDPKPLVRKINLFLGGELDESAMLRVVDPQLYRQQF